MNAIQESFTDKLFANYEANVKYQAIENAASHNGIFAALERRQSHVDNTPVFSLDLTKDKVTNQKASGRCWMFAALNTFRHKLISQYKLENFELSQAHTFFWDKYEKMLDWVVATYVEALNIIHYCHDRYAYESIEMALHDSDIVRTMGCGIAGLSIVADSLAAIKYAKVTPVRDETGLVVDYVTEGDFPIYGNDDDRADDIAATVVHTIMSKIKAQPFYRDAIPTQSVLTITSNVVYGKATGSFPSGHQKGTPFSPGANPENGMDTHGMVASMLSVGKLDYNDALDGISLTNTITPQGLGRTLDERVANLVGILDAGFVPDDCAEI